jgi:PilZ domain
MADQDTRREQRISRSELVLLSTLDQPSASESTRTQNISPRGARVFTQRVWQPGSRLLIRSLRGEFSARARVVYWRSFSSSLFAVGLEFKAGKGEWPSHD